MCILNRVDVRFVLRAEFVGFVAVEHPDKRSDVVWVRRAVAVGVRLLCVEV